MVSGNARFPTTCPPVSTGELAPRAPRGAPLPVTCPDPGRLRGLCAIHARASRACHDRLSRRLADRLAEGSDIESADPENRHSPATFPPHADRLDPQPEGRAPELHYVARRARTVDKSGGRGKLALGRTHPVAGVGFASFHGSGEPHRAQVCRYHFDAPTSRAAAHRTAVSLGSLGKGNSHPLTASRRAASPDLHGWGRIPFAESCNLSTPTNRLH